MVDRVATGRVAGESGANHSAKAKATSALTLKKE
jgi:hypothetical protein